MATLDEECTIRIFLRPHLDKILRAEDADYLDSLVADILSRSPSDQYVAFIQLCDLSVGPFRTVNVGNASKDVDEISAWIEKSKEG